jgi:hypothetical protein
MAGFRNTLCLCTFNFRPCFCHAVNALLCNLSSRVSVTCDALFNICLFLGLHRLLLLLCCSHCTALCTPGPTCVLARLPYMIQGVCCHLVSSCCSAMDEWFSVPVFVSLICKLLWLISVLLYPFYLPRVHISANGLNVFWESRITIMVSNCLQKFFAPGGLSCVFSWKSKHFI